MVEFFKTVAGRITEVSEFTEAATAAADKKPARATASKPSSDVGSDDAAFDVLMRIFDKDNR